MARDQGWRRSRVAIPLALLVMILMRLVWMQLRSYPIVVGARTGVAHEVLVAEVEPGCQVGRGGSRAAALPPAGPERVREAALAWVTSPGAVGLDWALCRFDALDERLALRLNQWLLVGTVLCATLMTRFITSSWTVSLIVAAMLLSRGRLLTDIGHLSADSVLMLLVTAWLAAAAHYFRTGAWASLVAGGLVMVAGALFDLSLLALGLAMPLLLLLGYFARRRLARPVIRRLRGAEQRLFLFWPRGASLTAEGAEGGTVGKRFVETLRWMLGLEFPPLGRAPGTRLDYGRGTLLRTLMVPFLLWAYWRRRWMRIAGGWLVWVGLGVAAYLAGMIAIFGQDLWPLAQAGWRALAEPGAGLVLEGWLRGWLALLAERFDLHLTVSLIILLICAFQSPAAGLPAFFECAWLALLAVIGLLLWSLGFDHLEAWLVVRLQARAITDSLIMGIGPRPVAVWIEPVLLSLGVAGVYNLMKVLDARIAERT